ncbi:hypothetical protein Hsar01_02178 [Haloferula sargassicola]|uniref:P/Homo B domain-containing protein n=2 Tax=Haloferula sargassicola TaxID=490096 RepID=A0ABP9UNF2_9BACT
MLDKAVVRQPDGHDRIVKLDPPATAEQLPGRLAAMNVEGTVQPLCYSEQMPGVYHIVTNDITVKLAQAGGDVALPAGLKVKERPSYAPDHVVISAADPFAALAAVGGLQQEDGVLMAEVQLARQLSRRTMPNDTLIGNQWHLKNNGFTAEGTDINVEEAWNYGGEGGVRGAGVVVGVCDDGLQNAHPDLINNIDPSIDYDWNDGDTNPSPGVGDYHGTACAGDVAAEGNNNLGVCGSAPEATLVGMRLIAGATTDSQEASAMAHKNDIIDIKTNSWGPMDSGQLLAGPGSLARAAIEDGVKNGRGGLGTVFLWAAGNGLQSSDNSNYDGWANNINVMAVTAMDSLGHQSYYAEPGANILLTAPSSGSTSLGALGITTTDIVGADGYDPTDYTSTFGGTSSATPTVAGVVALMLEKNPGLGWRDVQEILIRTAAKVDETDDDWVDNGAGFHFNHKYGAGRVDATAAVNMAEGWTNLEPRTSVGMVKSSLGLAIPDGNTDGVTTTFDMSSTNIRCERVGLTLSATHPFRGDLRVTLTSPSGTESVLAEQHGDDNANYFSWQFTSTHHWGENSGGIWTLRVADTSPGSTGTLTLASLQIYGTPDGPQNPAPTVQIVSPNSGDSFSVGTEVTVDVSADDLTLEGAPGVVASVELLDGDAPVGTVTEAPFTFSFTPTEGDHTLTAIATDSEGASAISAAVTIIIGDQPPKITDAGISPSSPAYSDEPLSVVDLTASDPEGDEITFSYTWEYSSDGSNWQASSETGSTLPAAPENSGKLWRCQIVASANGLESDPFTTGTVNVLDRPQMVVESGATYDYQSKLVLRGTPAEYSHWAIVNEFSQGVDGPAEWMEILVVRETSLVGWSIGDYDSTKRLTFSDVETWESVPAGTLIVIYYGLSKDTMLPADDRELAGGSMVISSKDLSLFSGEWPGFTNSGDAVIFRDDEDTVQTAFSWGAGTGPGPHFSNIQNNKAIYYELDNTDGLETSSNWTVTNADRTPTSPTGAGVTPALGNQRDNAGFVADLRAAAFDSPALFRLAEGTSLPEGLTLDPNTGAISGSVTAPLGHYAIEIERYNGLDEVVTQSFTLTVAQTVPFATWIAGYAPVDTTLGGDPDGDGLSNLLEYYLGSDPTAPSAGPTGSVVESELVMDFPHLKSSTEGTLTIEWSDDLAEWSSLGVSTEVISDDGDSEMIRASVDQGDGRRFMRLGIE